MCTTSTQTHARSRLLPCHATLNCIVMQYEWDTCDTLRFSTWKYSHMLNRHQTPDIVLSNHHYVELTQAHPNLHYNGVLSSLGIHVETWFICWDRSQEVKHVTLSMSTKLQSRPWKNAKIKTALNTSMEALQGETACFWIHLCQKGSSQCQPRPLYSQLQTHPSL